jgi:putative ABC transport system permease protein
MLGFDLDDAVYIPTVRAMSLFNQQSLMEIDILCQSGLQSKTISEKAKKLLKNRHSTEDFTITTQEEMLEVLGSVLGILTMAGR